MAYPEDFDDDFCQCPRCSGWGEIDCHCGGDLCVCEYYGEKPCPLCHGEGEISEEYAREYERRRKQHEIEMHAAWIKAEKEREAEKKGRP